MEEKRSIDGVGAAALIGFATLLAFNQVVVKFTGEGFGPVFQAGVRSVIGASVILIWMRARNLSLRAPPGVFWWAVLSGVLFALEFLCLFIALDLTTVSRASVIFYTMPIWLAVAGHFLLPGENLSGVRVLGLIAAMAGVVIALSDRDSGQASLIGDILALMGALLWAAIALLLRVTPLMRAGPELQLLFQLVVSAILLVALAPAFGPMVRDLEPIHLLGLAFQGICVVSLGFLVWFQLMKIYKASDIASFAFLSPVLAVLLGWLLLDETIGVKIWIALALVALGIYLINRRKSV